MTRGTARCERRGVPEYWVKSATSSSAGTWTTRGKLLTAALTASTRAQSNRTIAGLSVRMVRISINNELTKKYVRSRSHWGRNTC